MNYANRIINSVKQKYPEQTEFVQSVEEVLGSLAEFLERNPIYEEHKILERLVVPERVIKFRVAWLDDKNVPQVNTGYRVQFNSAIGPYKGGLRFHPTVNESIMKFLAFEQIFKNSLTGLPLGGAKGGADFDPKGRSSGEIMRFVQAFVTELYKYVGDDIDIPAGDIGVGDREIGYIFGQYKRLTNRFNGTFTGKNYNFGGSLIRPEATGYGVLYFVQSLIDTKNDSLEGKNILISGSGNVAQFAAEKAIALGAKVITMSDSDGVIFDQHGIDNEKLKYIMDLKNNKRGRIREYVTKFDAEYFDSKTPWHIPADIAIPCATQNEIDVLDALKLIENGVKYVIEGSNMSTTNEAIKKLRAAGIEYVPGKASNAGGVAVSGLEMAQNGSRLQWTKEEVDNKLRDIMKTIFNKCVENGQEGGVINFVKGSNIAGFKKVADAMISQGVV
ncbi:MAG: NADP-specific glutamate dehydrogenase [Candidatus Dojkabacteria bacterium]